MIIAIFAIAALIFYGIGFYIGRLFGQEEIMEKRQEMDIDVEKEEDPYDLFYKQ
jgi:membrane protein DedA with SNARE-associated domain